MPTNTEILNALYTQVPKLQASVDSLTKKVDAIAASPVQDTTVKGWVASALTDFFKKATG